MSDKISNSRRFNHKEPFLNIKTKTSITKTEHFIGSVYSKILKYLLHTQYNRLKDTHQLLSKVNFIDKFVQTVSDYLYEFPPDLTYILSLTIIVNV